MNRFAFLSVSVVAFLCLVWLSAGISLLDDDWGHLKLAANGVGFALSTGWEGLVAQGGYYRPIVVLSFYLNYVIDGFNPAGYHVLNVFIHALCAGLVFVLGRQLGLAVWPCFGGMVLFFVLPIHTDFVFWIVGRTDTICALFYLGSLIVFLMLLDDWAIWKLALLALCAGLAFLSKEMALTLPGSLLVLAWYRNRLVSKNGIFGVGAVGVMLVAYFGVRWIVLGGIFSGTPNIQFSIVRWGIDLAKSFAKFGMTDWKWFGSVVLLVTGGVFLLHRKKDTPFFREPPVLLVLVCGVSLLPVLGHLHNWYLYIPSAFFCLAVADVWLGHKKRIFSLLFAGLLLYYAGVLVREGIYWREASHLSEKIVTQLLPYAKKTQGRLFVLNTPSAWTPQNGIGGKPLFAFALKNALAMRSLKPVSAEIVMVNHVWLTEWFFKCDVKQDDRFLRLQMVEGGYFSFHGKEQLTPPFRLEKAWGALHVLSPHSLSVELDFEEADRVVYFDGVSFREI